MWLWLATRYGKGIQVVDGDTITIEGGYRVRYIGIDTPEIYPEVEAFGIKAWQANCRLVEGKEVRLERDISETDKYGRLLAMFMWMVCLSTPSW